MEEKYITSEGEKTFKTPKEPKPEDYFDTRETEEERMERIYLYSGVKENGD